MKRILLAALTVAFLAATTAMAAESSVEDAIRGALRNVIPDADIDMIESTPVDGLYSVTAGGHVFYVTADGRYLLQGELVDLQARRSLTEEKRKGIRLAKINAIGEDNMLIFEPDGPARYQITVFTDIDCPYCRRLHQHMDAYNELGIRVRYLLMPRAGINSNSYDKAVWAWCADDPHDALTRAKLGESIEHAECDNPVKEHMELARELGVRGTPTIVTGSGAMFSGYRSPEDMLATLKRDSQGLPIR